MAKSKAAPRRRFPKVQPREVTVLDAVTDAWSEIESLAQEMADWASGMEDKLSHTDKYTAVTECQETLEGGSEPSEPDADAVKELKLTITDMQPRARPYSRADRLAHAVYLLDQASDRLDQFSSSDDPDTNEDDVGEADTYKQEIDELKEQVEGAEFPGMY